MSQTGIAPTAVVAAVCVSHAADSDCRVRQWDLVEFAAEGSLARVFRARPAGGDQDRPAAYAVKMLRPCWQEDAHAIRLLQREALVGRSVSHPHLVPILTAAVLEAPRLLVMPWLDGASLATRLTEGQKFDVPAALWIVRQAAEGLAGLHAAGWIHGDVTPENIYVAPSGHVTLLDLSFARRRDEFGSAADRPIMGTCSYLAPEYLTSALKPDIRSDIYSLGAVLFEMLSGRKALVSDTLANLMQEHRQSSPADLARVCAARAARGRPTGPPHDGQGAATAPPDAARACRPVGCSGNCHLL